MSGKPNFAQMTTSELRIYVLQHREDEAAFGMKHFRDRQMFLRSLRLRQWRNMARVKLKNLIQKCGRSLGWRYSNLVLG